MWKRAWLAALLLLAACGSDSRDTSKLTLKNSFLDRVNVQVVITKSSDCDNRGPEFVGQQEFVLVKDRSRTILAPNGTSICWRKDRNPANPTPGQWSGWSRAILFPGEDTETEL
ncbi:MAG TPA: hypothetical protein VET89_07405 [Stellaceae bacterium]|nr:hypothetical protein [Stellaceae bacterium]